MVILEDIDCSFIVYYVVKMGASVIKCGQNEKVQD